MPIQEALNALKAAMENELASEAQLQDLKALIVQGHQGRIQAELDRYQSQIEQLNAMLANTPPMPEAPELPIAEAAAPSPEPTPEPVVERAPEPQAIEEPIAPPIAEKAPEAPAQPTMRQASTGGSVNARYAGLRVGLNDRVAFVKQLFEGRDDDFQRVIAALATLDSREECERFLNEAVYPDYNWEEKEEFAERFHALIYARFD